MHSSVPPYAVSTRIIAHQRVLVRAVAYQVESKRSPAFSASPALSVTVVRGSCRVSVRPCCRVRPRPRAAVSMCARGRPGECVPRRAHRLACVLERALQPACQIRASRFVGELPRARATAWSRAKVSSVWSWLARAWPAPPTPDAAREGRLVRSRGRSRSRSYVVQYRAICRTVWANPGRYEALGASGREIGVLAGFTARFAKETA